VFLQALPPFIPEDGINGEILVQFIRKIVEILILPDSGFGN
jgi:hypothetical protein